jgi:hypothetical protein
MYSSHRPNNTRLQCNNLGKSPYIPDNGPAWPKHIIDQGRDFDEWPVKLHCLCAHMCNKWLSVLISYISKQMRDTNYLKIYLTWNQLPSSLSHCLHHSQLHDLHCNISLWGITDSDPQLQYLFRKTSYCSWLLAFRRISVSLSLSLAMVTAWYSKRVSIYCVLQTISPLKA